ncbi:LRR and PYD domains-containing protein 14 (Nucleotide-binding oligomerization domain protein 5) [Durusdinium trenchii]|uniref:LRR and PYD domains-containing protein 14 (Nucleotide-binding oligomerization domain protein 5) n=1 Tax=Durusdinium trenchii TaxID=1381693 RepID=A0ABP0K0X3_9DINO
MSLVLAEEQETLDLQGQDLGRKGAQRLARALLPHQSLRELNLACTKLTDAGIAYVAGALQRNVSLVSVNLRNNELGDVGTEALASALSCAWKENESYQLVELNLSGNLFSDLGLQAFGEVLGSGCPLKLLELSHLKMVTVEGWELFVGYLGESRLETLKLRQNGAFGATAAQRLATALAQEGSHLAELDLSLCSVGLAAPVLLRASGQGALRQLQLLGNVGMDVEELGSALASSALDSLDLCRCGLSSSAGACLAAALQAAPELTVLHLDRALVDVLWEGNAFGFQGAIDLAKALRVPQCRLQAGADAPGGPAGRWRRRSPRRGLGGEHGLEGVGPGRQRGRRSGCHQFGFDAQEGRAVSTAAAGFEHQPHRSLGAEALAQGLEQNDTLRELDLSRNRLKMPGVSKLCAALEHNGSLSSLLLEGNEEVKSELLESVQQLAADVSLRRERQPKARLELEHESMSEDEEVSLTPSSASDLSEHGRPQAVQAPRISQNDQSEEVGDVAEETEQRTQKAFLALKAERCEEPTHPEGFHGPAQRSLRGQRPPRTHPK